MCVCMSMYICVPKSTCHVYICVLVCSYPLKATWSIKKTDQWGLEQALTQYWDIPVLLHRAVIANVVMTVFSCFLLLITSLLCLLWFICPVLFCSYFPGVSLVLLLPVFLCFLICFLIWLCFIGQLVPVYIQSCLSILLFVKVLSEFTCFMCIL